MTQMFFSEKVLIQDQFLSGTLVFENQKFKDFFPNTFINGALFFPDFLVPGLVNAHCHLELSHLEKLLPEAEGKGMSFFIQKIQNFRNQDKSSLTKKILSQLHLMYQSGTRILGDICNSADSVEAKRLFPQMKFVNFTEVFGLNPKISEENWVEKIQLNEILNGNLSLHSPYSCSSELVKKVHESHPKLQSIHIAESKEEIEFLSERKGKMLDTFLEMGLPREWLLSLHQSPENILQNIDCQYLLVHSCYLNPQKIDSKIFQNCMICICPISNLLLHNETISKDLIKKYSEKICIGTDSLASNTSLTLRSELNYLYKIGLPNEEIVKMATCQGAKALQTSLSFENTNSVIAVKFQGTEVMVEVLNSR